MLTKRILIFSAFFALVFFGALAQANFNHLSEITGEGRINSVRVDAKGNRYYSGNYSNGADFNVGPGTFTVASQGSTDVFIAKYDSSYNLIWVRTINSTATYDYGHHLAVDDSGYVYATGVIGAASICDLDPGPAVLSHTVSSAGVDVYIIKLDPAGNMKWVETFPSTNFITEWYIDIDYAGNIVTSGYYRAGTTIDLSFGIGPPQPRTFTTGKYGLLKQTKYQQFIWLKEGLLATHFDFDQNNNIYAVGDKMNIYKLNSAGINVWSYTLGTQPSFNVSNTSGDYASAICYDKFGNIYITGSNANSAIDYDPGSGVKTLTHNFSSREIYVLKWDTSAHYKWVAKFDVVTGCGNQYNNWAEDIKTDARGNVYTCGGVNACDFDPSPVSASVLGQTCNSTDLFISKLDSAGNYVWANSIGSVNGVDYLKTMAVTPAENVVYGGFFSYRLDIDPGPGFTYIGNTTGIQNCLLGGLGCNKFSEKKDSTCVFPYTLNSYTYTQGGRYVQSVAAHGPGCDSLIYLNLKMNNPDISVSSNTAICAGNSASLTVSSTSGNVMYQWSTGSNTPGITVNPGVTTVYTTTVTNTTYTNCQSVKAVSVTVNPLPVVSVVGSNTLCEGSQGVFTLGNAASYTCTSALSSTLTGNTFSTMPMPLGAGVYTITGTSSLGCVGTPTITNVYSKPSPTIIVNSGSVCLGQTFTINPSGASSYTYSSGTSTMSPVANTIYTVSGTAANGCLGSASGSVSIKPNPVLTVNSGSICAGQVFTITAGGASSYTYSSGSNTVSPLSTASYTITGTGVNNCADLSGVISNVFVTSLPNVTASASSSVICTGSPVTLAGGGATAYIWTNGVQDHVPFTPLSTTVYEVTGTTNGCSNTATVQIIVNTCTGLETLWTDDRFFVIYPNPANTSVTIQSSNTLGKIELTSLTGQFILTENVSGTRHQLDVSELANGVYFVTVYDTSQKVMRKKLVVQR